MGPFTDGWTTADVETVVARGEPAELLYVPILVGMSAADCGRAWAERICLDLARHPEATVRGNAMTGLGHIARTCRALEPAALQAIADGLHDADEWVRSHAGDAADDVELFLDAKGPGSGASPE